MEVSTSKGKQTSGPWAAQQPYLRDIYSRAESLFQKGPYEYGPGRVQGFDPTQYEALRMAENRARGGSEVGQEAQGLAASTLRGDYLSPETNPWLARTGEIGARDIRRNYYDTISGLGSRMEAAGRTGSGAHATGTAVANEKLATGLGDFFARLYGGAYQQERGIQSQMAAMAPQFQEMDYRDINAMMTAGQMRQEQAQRERDELVERFRQQQYGEQEKLAEFSSLIGQPVQTSRGKQSSTGVSMFWG